MTRQQRFDFLLDYFRREQPVVESELHYDNAFQLLVAVMLSAQCTDRRVNMVTPALFARYPDAAAMAGASPAELLPLMGSVSYPNAKARHLVEAARMVAGEYGGAVPDDEALLMRLPGVGRKTAHVVQAVWFGRSAMAVDTHIYRVSHRLGLVPEAANTPTKVEQALVRSIPEADIPRAHHWLLLHGRYICTARAPKCAECPFADFCPKNV